MIGGLLFALSPALIEEIVRSGRVLQLTQTASERVAVVRQIAPGAPPILSFRVLEGRMRHRFGDIDLVLDDAGH